MLRVDRLDGGNVKPLESFKPIGIGANQSLDGAVLRTFPGQIDGFIAFEHLARQKLGTMRAKRGGAIISVFGGNGSSRG
jgi:hypothetical protein